MCSSDLFSFNVKGGRCEACKGDGTLKIEMNFLPDVYVPCEVCGGARYNRETLDIRYKDATVADVLDMTIRRASEFFAATPIIARHLDTLVEISLSYMRLGQFKIKTIQTDNGREFCNDRGQKESVFEKVVRNLGIEHINV